MKLFLLIVLSYLIGAIPFSYVFSKLKGKDVRQSGTKNVGATNALVVAGPLMGVLALAGDIAKGYLAVSVANYVFHPLPWPPVLAGLAAIAGHDFSVFLGFRGGKGVAATGGALMAFDLIFALVALLLWVLLIIVSRYFIPATLFMLGAIPIMMWVVGKRMEYVAFGIFAFALALYAHREDIKRIVSGKELTTSDTITALYKKVNGA